MYLKRSGIAEEDQEPRTHPPGEKAAPVPQWTEHDERELVAMTEKKARAVSHRRSRVSRLVSAELGIREHCVEDAVDGLINNAPAFIEALLPFVNKPK